MQDAILSLKCELLDGKRRILTIFPFVNQGETIALDRLDQESHQLLMSL